VFSAVRRFLARGRVHLDPEQLGLDLDRPVSRSADQAISPLNARSPERLGAEFLVHLRSRGLKSIKSLTLTKNARVMVSFRGSEMRVHRGYVDAPPEVLDAIVRLVEGRTKAIRREAGKFVVANAPKGLAEEPKRRERTHADDVAASNRLAEEHRRLNGEHFSGSLRSIEVRVSRRMKSRLGHYSPKTGDMAAEIAISRRHIRRHGWEDALDTLLHEMVHQWQDETGLPLDHGRHFRRKAKEVGIRPSARREV
jgi:hypothetical protein